MSEETELKPCPCCNSSAIEIFGIGANKLVLKCTHCGLRREQKTGRMTLGQLRAAMVKSWNTRPIEDQLRTTARAYEVIIQTAHESLTAAGHTAEVDGYIPGAINELAAERDQLRAEVERLREAGDALDRITLAAAGRTNYADLSGGVVAMIEDVFRQHDAAIVDIVRLRAVIEANYKMLIGQNWDKMIWDELIEMNYKALRGEG